MLTLLYRQGRTLEEIGRFIGVSRERVRQLIDTSVGGKRLQAANRRTRLAAINIKKHRRQELKFEAIFGCPYEEITRINGAYWNYGSSKSRGSDRATAFFNQRRFAETRGIEWKLSFPEWWRIWDDSGHWSERGRGKHRYCMSRPGDTGPYAVGNVEIITNQQNSSDSQKNRRKRDELGLTVRERGVYDLMKAGVTSPKDLAIQTGLASRTAAIYKVNLRKKGYFK